MLEVAKVTKSDIVYDLGCGDGRIPITAAKDFGAHAVCIDIDPDRVSEALANAQAAGVEKMIDFQQKDLFKADIHNATVVTLYLLPRINLKLRPKLLRELKPGTRIVSHSFDMGDWKPQKLLALPGAVIYFWIVPGP
jgi:ribosomal protein L11 methylase PrmA